MKVNKWIKTQKYKEYMSNKKLTEDEILELAYKMAKDKSGVLHFRHGCVIVSNDNVLIATGYNDYFTEVTTGKFKGEYTRHAEAIAIERAIRRFGANVLINAKIYVIKITGTGVIIPSDVCDVCKERIIRAKIAKAYYYAH